MPPTLEQLRRRADQAYAEALAHPELVRGPFAYGVNLSAQVATETARAQLGTELDATASVATTEAFQAGQDDGLGVFTGGKAPPFATYATFDGPGGGNICPLCLALKGQTFKVDSEAYQHFRPPLHINERHYYTYHGGPAPEREFREPPVALVKRHGHFIGDPEKYKPLRVPASPTGRSFVFRRTKNPVTGELESSLEWLKQPERPLSRAARELATELQAKASVIPAEAWENAARAEGPLAELSRAGYVRVTKQAGNAKTLTVSRTTAAEVEEWLKTTRAGATVEKIEQVPAVTVGGHELPQWQVTFREPDARRVALNDWGDLAATVATEKAAGKAAAGDVTIQQWRPEA